MDNNFIIQKPFNAHLQTLVEYYFFIDIPVSELKFKEEYVVPFPRITFGYFFDHPFLVTNHATEETLKTEMIISRISTTTISVKPLTDRVKILGAHIKPYTLAHLTNANVSKLNWLINTVDLFGKNAEDFKKKVNRCQNSKQMFAEIETIFLNSILSKDLTTIIKAVDRIESEKGAISIASLSDELGITSRTLRNYFYKSLGCSPKEYIHLVKLKQSVYQMKYSKDSLTSVSYSQNYADQAHFTNTVKNITGSSPKEIRENLPDFRFLQF